MNPKVSINFLTKDREKLIPKAFASIRSQTFTDYEVVVVNDGSTDGTEGLLKDLKFKDLKIITHSKSIGITQSRQEAVEASSGEYIAVLDDDDEWVDVDKLKKQVEFLENHRDCVLVGGGVQISNSEFLISKQIPNLKFQITKFRPETDAQIRNWMLFKNPFFTSTVMFRREAAIRAGGFVKDGIDLAEDYDLWLRLGEIGKMYNFQEVFTLYSKSSYNKEKLLKFYQKQQQLIGKYKNGYPFYWLARLILRIRSVLLSAK